MLRLALSIVLGYSIWTAVFLGGGALVRGLMPDVHDPGGMTSDSAALALVLMVSVIASIVAGWLSAMVAPLAQPKAGWVLAACLLATGIGVQFTAGIQLPVWYNLAFLYLLVPVTMLGAKLGSAHPNHNLEPV